MESCTAIERITMGNRWRWLGYKNLFKNLF